MKYRKLEEEQLTSESIVRLPPGGWLQFAHGYNKKYPEEVLILALDI